MREIKFRAWRTGLKDKNGREIYEGDIVVLAGWLRSIVKWISNLADFGFESDDSQWHPLGKVLYEIEVIGNIYENPEPKPGA